MFRNLLFAILTCFSLPLMADNIWIEIDTQALTLQVKQEKHTLETFKNIAIGRNGAGVKLRKGDDITPLGSYKIGWINENSHYYRFYGFDYPSIENAETALVQGLIDDNVFQTIKSAHKNGQIPSQTTALGGQLGIHGLGNADLHIHKILNWTHGCIALTNEQIDRLHPWLKKGTLVKIK